MNTSTPDGRGMSRWMRVRLWLRRHIFALILTVLVTTLLVVVFWPSVAVTIEPGQAGVLWQRFGNGTVTVASDGKPFVGRIQANAKGEVTGLDEQVDDKEHAYSKRGYHVYPFLEGTHYIFPWDKMYIYNVRLQQVTHTFGVLTSDGLEIQAEIAITWKPLEPDLGRLHRDIGPNYVNVLLIPTVGSCAREEIARFRPDALYSAQRLAIQESIRDCVRQTMLSRFYPLEKRESYLMVEDVLIRDVHLPVQVRDAIADKVAQKHLAESYQYRLTRERLEADRKAIEAEGIRRFQATINSTISDGYLKWKGIDATLELARSPNAKVVVIGAGKDGMPIILGGLDNVPGAPKGPAMPATGPAPPALTPTAAATAAPSSLPPTAAATPNTAPPPGPGG